MQQENKEQQYQDLIDAWLAGALSAADRADFERKRREDPELDAHCRFVQKLTGALQHQKKQEFGVLIRDIEGELEQQGFFQKKPLWIRMRPLLAYAATLVLLIGAVGIWNYQRARQMAGQARDLSLKTIAALPPLPKPADRQGMTGQNDQTAYELYAQGRLTEAKNSWQQQYDSAPGDVNVRYYLAVCRLQLGETPAARALLENLDARVRAGDKFRGDFTTTDVRWHLALALAAEGEWKKAKRLLREIENEHPGARQFLQQMEKR